MGDVWLHCARHGEHFGLVETSYLAERDDGELRWMHTTHVTEYKAHLGARSSVGWYSSASRGGRSLSGHYCADEREAIGLLLEEVFLPASPDEKWKPHLHLTSRFHGSLAPTHDTPSA